MPRVSKYLSLSYYRCKSFVEASGGEVCVIPGSTVTPGSPQTTIRLPQYQPVIFRQVINYIYTGKVVAYFHYVDFFLYVEFNILVITYEKLVIPRE